MLNNCIDFWSLPSFLSIVLLEVLTFPRTPDLTFNCWMFMMRVLTNFARPETNEFIFTDVESFPCILMLLKERKAQTWTNGTRHFIFIYSEQRIFYRFITKIRSVYLFIINQCFHMEMRTDTFCSTSQDKFEWECYKNSIYLTNPWLVRVINVKKIAFWNKEHTTDKKNGVSVLLRLSISSNEVCNIAYAL